MDSPISVLRMDSNLAGSFLQILLVLLFKLFPSWALHRSELFSFRPSTHPRLTGCDLQSIGNQAGAFRCFKDCLHNPCCKAVDINTCEQSYVTTERFHFVKLLPNPAPREDCSCSVSVGSQGGGRFSMFGVYQQSGTSIKSITLRRSYDGYVIGIEVEYGDGLVAVWGDTSTYLPTHHCQLQEGEFITSAKGYVDDAAYYGVPIVKTVEFQTPTQTCGPYASTSGLTVQEVSGHQLLYLSGWAGMAIDQLTLNFDYGCA